MKGFIEVTDEKTNMPVLVAISSIGTIEALNHPVSLITLNLPNPQINPYIYTITNYKTMKEAIEQAQE